jgi:hypothetical protein
MPRNRHKEGRVLKQRLAGLSFDRIAERLNLRSGEEAREIYLAIREDAAAPPAEQGNQISERGQLLTESAATAEAPHRRLAQIITPGWGSSGYYSPEVLEAAAADKVIPAGTHMYLNHASETERADRPERDVKEIAAVLVEDAAWDGSALTAPVDLLGANGELVEALAPYIGLSISGSAKDIVVGEAEGRRGPIIEGLAYVESVDFVTRAGRGGMLLLESARPSLVNASAVGHGLAEATVNDTRDQLSNLLRDAYGAEKTYVWVRDFDATNVWFEVEDPNGSGVYGQSYTETDGAVTLTGARAEVRVQTTYVPVARPDSSTATQESKEDTMPQIEEARLRQLEEDAGRVVTLEAERDAEKTRADTAEARSAQLEAREGAQTRARKSVGEANAELSPIAVDRIVESVMTGDLPLTEAGALDEAAFDAAVEAARKTEETYLAKLAEGKGAGTVSGFGSPAQPGSSTTTPVGESAPATSPWGTPLTKIGA